MFEDPYARAFLGPELGAVLALGRVPVMGGLVAEAIDRGWPGARVAVVVRTRFIDDVMETALAEGIDQVVILGAGFDTRAYRIEGVESAQIFEVDEPATLAVKRARMQRLLGTLPTNVTLVAMDFDRDDLAASLCSVGLRREARTLFLWEGVTSYLSAAGVDATFRHLSTLGASDSRIVFTYVDRAALEGRTELPGVGAVMMAVRRAGEPFRFGFDAAELPGYVADRGLELIEDVSTAELAVRYLHPRGRRPVASPFFRLAIAASDPKPADDA
jgi:methyltransferase (TIGR00027 family)